MDVYKMGLEIPVYLRSKEVGPWTSLAHFIPFHSDTTVPFAKRAEMGIY
jgi:hypothetical protein